MGTQHDKEILNSIFNPLLPLSGELVQEEEILEEIINVNLEKDDENVKISRELEIEGVKAAEGGQFDKGIDLMSRAIALAPHRSSGYNNRAQIYRLMGNIQLAKIDLNNAINLSNGKGRVGCQAFCQRGLINLREKHEDEAKKDFEAAAKLGSQFAKAHLVQMNPYAALCNNFLRDVMGKIQRGESEYYKNNQIKN